MIKAHCPFCGAAEKKLLYARRDGLKIQLCKSCFLQYLSPRLDAAAQRALYADEAYYACWGLDSEASNTVRQKRQMAGQILEKMEKFQPHKGQLLEIGCAMGFFLEEAILKGWSVYGLDLSPYAISQAQERLREKAVLSEGLLQEETFAGVKFNAVVMLDLIEHVEDPLAFLRLVRQKTMENGFAFLLTPDAGSFSRRLLGKKWPHYKWEHLFYLDEQKAGDLLVTAGWQVIAIEEFTKPMSFNYLQAHYQTFPSFPFTQLINFGAWLLPSFLKRKIFNLPLGQMLIIAQNKEKHEA